MSKVTNGKYVGELTPEETVEQFLYRISIHETYAGLVLDNPQGYIAFGSYEFHLWAINGYEWGIKYIQENNPVVYKCTLGGAVSTILRALIPFIKSKIGG